MAKKTLVVDDDPLNVKLIEVNLEKQGFEVINAVNGKEGLETVKKEKPGLIILDVEMPEMDGYAFLNEFNKLGELKNIPVVVLTSHQDMQPIFQRHGVKAYLTKPLDSAKLIKITQQYLE